MTQPTRLFLYEEIMLLALRNLRGTLSTAYAKYAVAGALLAEMLLEGRIAADGMGKKLIDVRSTAATGDPLLDESLKKMAGSTRRASLRTWVTRLAGTKGLRHRVARQLCQRGILRADEEMVLLLFRRKVYPEVNPEPESRLIERMRAAIVSTAEQVDPRTVVLISLAKSSGLLAKTLGRDEMKKRKERINQIINGEATGKATKEVIEACEAAVVVAVILPGIVASSNH